MEFTCWYCFSICFLSWYWLHCVHCVSSDLAVRRLVGNCNMLPRGPCFPQGHPVQLSWRNGPSNQQKQQASGWSLDGWFQRFLLYNLARYRAVWCPHTHGHAEMAAGALQVSKVLGNMSFYIVRSGFLRDVLFIKVRLFKRRCEKSSLTEPSVLLVCSLILHLADFRVKTRLVWSVLSSHSLPCYIISLFKNSSFHSVLNWSIMLLSNTYFLLFLNLTSDIFQIDLRHDSNMRRQTRTI